MSSLALPRGRAETRRAHLRRRHSPAAPIPWARRDAVVLVVALVLALLGLVIGWVGISDTVELDSQARWLAFGIGALMLGGLGMLAWLLAGLRNVAVLRREVLTETDRRHPARSAVAAPPASGTGVFGTVPGMRRFHALGCLMLADKQTDVADAGAHRAAGLLPCGICLPAGVGGDAT